MKYTANISQAQIVGGVKIYPQGGTLSDIQIKAIKKDKYGEELLEKKLLVLGDTAATAPKAATISDNVAGGDVSINKRK
jgi:hypothetical protein